MREMEEDEWRGRVEKGEEEVSGRRERERDGRVSVSGGREGERWRRKEECVCKEKGTRPCRF